MQLLVSVADAADAVAAIDGGADIIDAKDPARGPLGPVTPATLAAIIATVAGRRPVSAAGVARAGLAFAKLEYTARGARAAAATNDACRIVLAAYADAPEWDCVIDAAVHCGAKGVLLDTRDKDAPGLFGVLSDEAIERWVQRAHATGLTVALAGKLTAADIPRVEALGADIAGVRGAVCEGGRGGRVSAEKVRALIAPRQSAATLDYCESANR
jgi:(5-formylfuran-3-yl)methyl phosphate synthase